MFFTLVPTLMAFVKPFGLRSLMTVTVSPSCKTLPAEFAVDPACLGGGGARIRTPLVGALGAHEKAVVLVGEGAAASGAGR